MNFEPEIVRDLLYYKFPELDRFIKEKWEKSDKQHCLSCGAYTGKSKFCQEGTIAVIGKVKKIELIPICLYDFLQNYPSEVIEWITS